MIAPARRWSNSTEGAIRRGQDDPACGSIARNQGGAPGRVSRTVRGMSTAAGTVLVHRTERVASITLNRPDSMNAMTGPMVSAMTRIVETLATDESVEVVVIRAAGANFCAGSDMSDLSAVLGASPAERQATFEHGMQTTIQPLLRALLALRQPVLAAARGHVIGIGVTFLLAADLVVLSDTTKIAVPQVRLGHTLDHGESWLLPRRVGLSRAMQISLLGDRLSGVDAERLGLANWLAADDELESRTDDLVAGLLRVAPIPLTRTKALLRASATATLEEQLSAEVVSASQCATTNDFVEAITAQVDRRSPRFVGS